MAMAMVRRRIAGFAKIKRKRVPLPKKTDPNAAMVGGEARVYSPMAAVGRPVVRKSFWQVYGKLTLAGIVVLIACIVAFATMRSPSRPNYDVTADRQDYPKTASASRSRIVGAVATRSGGQAADDGRLSGIGGGEMVLLTNRAAQTDDSFRASAHVRKVFLPEISGNCVVTGSGSRDIGECLRQQAGE